MECFYNTKFLEPETEEKIIENKFKKVSKKKKMKSNLLLS